LNKGCPAGYPQTVERFRLFSLRDKYNVPKTQNCRRRNYFFRNKVLLVRYKGNTGIYLACPGGGLQDEENIIAAIIRETKEEAGIIVKPQRIVIIKDLISNKYENKAIKMIKIWMVCRYLHGKITKTAASKLEGITEIGWFSRDQLKKEKVYPELLLKNWTKIRRISWKIRILQSRMIL
jgi:ADP-ribose pyrophosphatase YjhB (NUDIX family)